MVRVRDLLDSGRARLAAAGIEHSAREAALLLRTLLEMSEAALLARDREPVSEAVAARFGERLARRAAGVPSAYVIGEREFFGRSFVVDDRVLIPRPETELLVEIACDLDLPERARVLDFGCGSGCLAVTLALERPDWQFVALDRSLAALAVTARNARRHRVARRVRPVASDLVSTLDLETFDLVVANPPYVDPRDEIAIADVAQHEPHDALFADEGGLAVAHALLRDFAALRAGAWFVVEHGSGQRAALREFAERVGGWRLDAERDDLAGHDRGLVWQRMP